MRSAISYLLMFVISYYSRCRWCFRWFSFADRSASFCHSEIL